MSCKRHLLEYEPFRGVLPALAEEKPILQNEPNSGMERRPGTPLRGMDLPKRGLDLNPLER